MAKQSSQLSWCVIRLGSDMNWWVHETSDPIHWDTEGLSMLDPRQISYVLDLCEPLRDYGFDIDLMEAAFYSFRVEKEAGEGKIRLQRIRDSIVSSEEKLFALPDVLDEEKGPYAELLDQLIKARVKLLNDSIEFEQPLTADEIEDALNERNSLDFSEGRSVHVFAELLSILEYIPEGYEDEVDEPTATKAATSPIDEIPDIEEEDLEEDETMNWGDEDDEEKDEADGEEGDEDEDDEDEDEDEDAPKKKPSKTPAPKKPAKPAKPQPKKKK